MKQIFYLQFLKLINERALQYQRILADLKDSGSNETKSTAGDKHETALAMIQIEQANVRGQLHELLIQKAAFNTINSTAAASLIIINGSLVHTNKGVFYLSAALGKIIFEGKTVTAISLQSPLGKSLLGLKKGATAQVNNHQFVIEQID